VTILKYLSITFPRVPHDVYPRLESTPSRRWLAADAEDTPIASSLFPCALR
jgi:hypothetical protein